MQEFVQQIKKDLFKRYRYLVPLILAALLFTRVYSPLYSRLYDTKVALYKAKTEQLEKTRYAANLDRLLKHKEAIDKKMLQAERVFFLSADFTETLAWLQSIANEHGANVSSIKPGGQVKNGALAYIPVDMEIKSDFISCLKFINAVQNQEKLVVVDKIKMEKEKTNLINSELTFNLYVK